MPSKVSAVRRKAVRIWIEEGELVKCDDSSLSIAALNQISFKAWYLYVSGAAALPGV